MKTVTRIPTMTALTQSAESTRHVVGNKVEDCDQQRNREGVMARWEIECTLFFLKYPDVS